ncbi:MAG TPA: terminase TerL endonuclease subunit [Pararhizobium sp.]|uniref:terminase TerL endonuclease subunit n=1 Tax=Pararhizobium sp. TaxID=1977563 RepID=UPI002C837F44|nr:terminase TerL endonuclease subunit [Pararhizobium sp.]HTO30297.1 terminase TerL endonuclease subunit [Pararhizobium sp.]
MSEPLKEVEGLIRSRKIAHDGDPAMTWMLSNLVAKPDAKDNVYPRKERPENKIEGPVALVMAMGRHLTSGCDLPASCASNGSAVVPPKHR